MIESCSQLVGALELYFNGPYGRKRAPAAVGGWCSRPVVFVIIPMGACVLIALN